MFGYKYYLCLTEKPVYFRLRDISRSIKATEQAALLEGKGSETPLSDYSRLIVIEPSSGSNEAAPAHESDTNKGYVLSCISVQKLHLSLLAKSESNITPALGLEKLQESIFRRRLFILEKIPPGEATSDGIPQIREDLEEYAKDVGEKVQIKMYRKHAATAGGKEFWELDGRHNSGSEMLEAVADGIPTISPIFDEADLSPVFHDKNRIKRTLDMCEFSQVKDLWRTVLNEVPDLKESRPTVKSKDDLKHPLIVVEGMDGAGKTTLVQELARKLNGKSFHSPMEVIRPMREFFDKQPEIVRRAYYTLGNYLAAELMAKECERCAVVLDRHWHSSAAYGIANEASSADMPTENHRDYRWPKDLPQPSLVIFLTVTEEVRLARLNKRDGEKATLEEKNLARDREFRNRLLKAYRGMLEPAVVEVDADGTKEEVVDKAMSELRAHKIIK